MKNENNIKEDEMVRIGIILSVLDMAKEDYSILREPFRKQCRSHTREEWLAFYEGKLSFCRAQREVVEYAVGVTEEHGLTELYKKAMVLLGRKLHYELALAEKIQELRVTHGNDCENEQELTGSVPADTKSLLSRWIEMVQHLGH